MATDLIGDDDAPVVAVLLHPHPDYGGDRYHPFVGEVFRRVPAAVRFDFASGAVDGAVAQTVAAIDMANERWPTSRIVLAGYSFGAGIAANVDDGRVDSWFLLAPQVPMLERSPIGGDGERPKSILVPEHDQYSPPDAVRRATDRWRATSVATVAGDHFLATVITEVTNACVAWVLSRADAQPSQRDLHEP